MILSYGIEFTFSLSTQVEKIFFLLFRFKIYFLIHAFQIQIHSNVPSCIYLKPDIVNLKVHLSQLTPEFYFTSSQDFLENAHYKYEYQLTTMDLDFVLYVYLFSARIC